MSYRIYSFVTKNESNNHLLKEDVVKNFRFHFVREIFTPFRGLVCLAYHSHSEIDFKRFPDEYFKNQEEVEEFFTAYTAQHLLEFSKSYPDQNFAYVEVDCFGGMCMSNGHMVKDGIKDFENEPQHSGHMELFSKLDPAANSWFFYPFRRTFFNDKGGVTGEIVNIGWAAVWMVINIDYGQNSEFDFRASENEMLLIKTGEYELYFMKIDDARIKVLGTFDIMSEQNVTEMKALIEDCFVGMKYYFSLDDFETGQQIELKTMDDAMVKHLAGRSYRAKAFNERPFSFDNIAEKAEQQNNADADSRTDQYEHRKSSSGLSGFFKRLLGRSN